MIPRHFLEYLHLDTQLIEREKTAYESLALAYEKWIEIQENIDEGNISKSVAATLFRKAAAHALLLGNYDDAREMFSKSATTYSLLKSPYAVLLSAFTNQIPESWEQLAFWADDKVFNSHFHVSQPQTIYLLLHYSSYRKNNISELNAETINNIRLELEAFRSTPLGVLALPIGNYLDLVDAFDNERSQRDISIDEASLPFLFGYNMAIRQAMENGYHWRRLAMPFHPIEPDMFAVLLLVNRFLISTKDRTVSELINNLPLMEESKILLTSILDDYDNYSDRRG